MYANLDASLSLPETAKVGQWISKNVCDFKESSLPGVATESDLMKHSFCSNFTFQIPPGRIGSMHMMYLGMSYTDIPSSPKSGVYSWKTERNSHSNDLKRLRLMTWIHVPAK